ncbi:hypothetical protein TARUN_537 [Trichoderma arundinaceum]|uniref:Uncharacterized protein n=1 Tax=Trichoderma arundinaceum TaxID=490622 RepID=A0A395P017_TRIAR|nr:hypothetical protein TARUN_537 [Trichoderma arundinaceum]
MVDDEFLHMAQRFTPQLHRAEYDRLKALSKPKLRTSFARLNLALDPLPALGAPQSAQAPQPTRENAQAPQALAELWTPVVIITPATLLGDTNNVFSSLNADAAKGPTIEGIEEDLIDFGTKASPSQEISSKMKSGLSVEIGHPPVDAGVECGDPAHRQGHYVDHWLVDQHLGHDGVQLVRELRQMRVTYRNHTRYGRRVRIPWSKISGSKTLSRFHTLKSSISSPSAISIAKPPLRPSTKPSRISSPP